MLEIAKERSKALGFENIITFKEADIERLDLPNSFFDLAVSRWGLMFLPNLNTVLKKYMMPYFQEEGLQLLFGLILLRYH
ncbi:MAG: class I SAM-dependent methyltransferase [Thermoproteota archaeon]|nr:class I SAM-dependent methyltransferase [Thermoproteota archaeon]